RGADRVGGRLRRPPYPPVFVGGRLRRPLLEGDRATRRGAAGVEIVDEVEDVVHVDASIAVRVSRVRERGTVREQVVDQVEDIVDVDRVRRVDVPGERAAVAAQVDVRIALRSLR